MVGLTVITKINTMVWKMCHNVHDIASLPKKYTRSRFEKIFDLNQKTALLVQKCWFVYIYNIAQHSNC